MAILVIPSVNAVWWNSSCNYMVPFNKTGTDNFTWRAVFWNLNSTNINWTAITNESSLYVVGPAGDMVNFDVLEFNHTSNTSILWVNASPYNSSVMNYSVYYNCTLNDARSPANVFLYYEYGDNTTTWVNVTGTTVRSNTMIVRWGNSSLWVKTTSGYYVYHPVANYTNGSLKGGNLNGGPELVFEQYVFDNSGANAVMSGCSNAAVYDNGGDLRARAASSDFIYYNVGEGSVSIGAYVSGTWEKVKTVWNLNTSTNVSARFDIYLGKSAGAMNYPNRTAAKTRGTFYNCNSSQYTTNNYGTVYYDNIIAYPWYNWTSEVNVYGIQEINYTAPPATDTCTCPSPAANWRIALTDHCNITAACNLRLFNVSFENGTTGDYANVSAVITATYFNFSLAGSGARLNGYNGGYLNCSS